MVKKGDNIQITAKKEITAEVLLDQKTQKGEYVFLSFRVENHQPSKDVSVTINGIKNKLSSTDTEYYNNNEIFHYTFAVREGTQKLAVRFGEGDYELRQVSCRVGLVDETKNAALYKNPADLKLSASGNGYAGDVQAETDQWMITSIPFDDSLKIYVDGTQVETVRVNGSFAGARVSKGAHRIELRDQGIYPRH